MSESETCLGWVSDYFPERVRPDILRSPLTMVFMDMLSAVTSSTSNPLITSHWLECFPDDVNL